MVRPTPLPSDLEVSFTVREARAFGVSASRLRRADLHDPFHGARTTALVDGLRGRAAAYAPLLDAHQRFSHTTAAALCGLRMPDGFREEAVHVTSHLARHSIRRPLVVGHTSEFAADVAVSPDGFRVTSAVEAWCECAAMLHVDDLVVMGDGLVSRGSAVATLADLERAVASRPGRRGTARLRLALDGIRPGTDSARETTLRQVLVRAGLPEPEVNGKLFDRRGRLIAHGDLVWRTARVVGEYDGRHHALDAHQFAVDIRRLNAIADAGYRVIRVDSRLFSNHAELLRLFRRALHVARRET